MTQTELIVFFAGMIAFVISLVLDYYDYDEDEA